MVTPSDPLQNSGMGERVMPSLGNLPWIWGTPEPLSYCPNDLLGSFALQGAWNGPFEKRDNEGTLWKPQIQVARSLEKRKTQKSLV